MSKDVDAGSLTRLCVYFFLLAGSVLSVAALFSCEFLSYQPSSVDADLSPLEPPFYENRTASVGFLRFEVFDEPTGCLAYWDTDNVPDYSLWSTEMEFAQASTGVLLVLAFFTAMVVTIEYCCISNCGWNAYIISFLLMLCTLFQGLTFLLFQAEDFCSGGRTCQMESGAVLSIVAACLFFLSGIAILLAPAPSTTLCQRLSEEKCCCSCKKKDKQKKKKVTASMDPDAHEYEEGELVEYDDDDDDEDEEVDEEKGDTNVVIAKTFEDDSNEEEAEANAAAKETNEDEAAADDDNKEDQGDVGGTDEEAPPATTEEADDDAAVVKESTVSAAAVTEEVTTTADDATPTPATEEKEGTASEPPPESTKFSSSLIAGAIPASALTDDSQNE